MAVDFRGHPMFPRDFNRPTRFEFSMLPTGYEIPFHYASPISGRPSKLSNLLIFSVITDSC